MSYSIRDVDSALMNIIKARNITVDLEGKDVRVRVYVGSPDELIAQRRLPFIGIESGWMIRTPEIWQPSPGGEVEVVGNSVDVYSCRTMDVFYTYKVGFYVTYQPHCAQLELDFIRMFPNKFLADVIDASGIEYKIPFVCDPAMINMDEATSAFKKTTPVSDGNLDSDLRIYRRDKLMTAQLMIEERSVETLLRPWNGMSFTVGMTDMTVPATVTVATITMPTIIFVEE